VGRYCILLATGQIPLPLGYLWAAKVGTPATINFYTTSQLSIHAPSWEYWKHIERPKRSWKPTTLICIFQERLASATVDFFNPLSVCPLIIPLEGCPWHCFSWFWSLSGTSMLKLHLSKFSQYSIGFLYPGASTEGLPSYAFWCSIVLCVWLEKKLQNRWLLQYRLGFSNLFGFPTSVNSILQYSSYPLT